MRIRVKLIRQEVDRLLDEMNIHEPPIPVRKIARHCNARVVRVPGEDDDELSGFLYREDDHAVIGVNKDHAPVRQRFTISHEIAHLLLHEHDQVHVDRGFRLRNRLSSEGTDRDEVEANRFAAELLMPIRMLRADVQNRDFDLANDDELLSLARRYGVSTQALSIRLNALGYEL